MSEAKKRITETDISKELLDSAYMLATQQELQGDGSTAESLRRIPVSKMDLRIENAIREHSEIDDQCHPDIRTHLNALDQRFGDLEQLETEDKSSLVAAVNEVLGKAGTGGSGGNADQSGLTAEQISALDGMFKICAYTADTTDAYKAFQTAFGIGGSGGGEVEPDVPVGPEEPETGVSNEATWTDGVAYDISWTDGIYISLNGEEKTYSGWKATQYLYCDGAAKLTISNTAGSPGEYSSFYDVNKVYISSFSGGAVNTNDHIIPENAVYFRVSCITNNVSNIIPHARV